MAKGKIEITVDKNEKIRQAILEHAGEIYSNAINSVIPTMVRRADLIFRTAIDVYYDSYSPFVYERTESLYSVFKPRKTKNGFKLFFDARYMKGGHRVDNEYIYNVMFKKGYHGGAPHNGDYYWRWPSPRTLHESGIPPYSMWYLWGPAVQSESPWDRIKAEWSEYVQGEAKQLLINAFRSQISRVIKGVS